MGDGTEINYFWKLGPDGRTPVPATLLEWADMRESLNRVLWKDEVGDISVMTLFHGDDPDVMLGEHHEPQRLFGTRVTKGMREFLYATYEEAEAGHQRIVRELRGEKST